MGRDLWGSFRSQPCAADGQRFPVCAGVEARWEFQELGKKTFISQGRWVSLTLSLPPPALGIPLAQGVWHLRSC